MTGAGKRVLPPYIDDGQFESPPNKIFHGEESDTLGDTVQSPTTLPTDEEDWSDQDKTQTQKRTPEDFYKIVSVRDKYINVQFLNLDNVGFEEATPLLGSIFQSII